MRDIGIATALIIAVLAVYGQTLSFEYLNYDDNLYVTGCAHTKAGLSWDNVRWAFTTGTASNWHPLTWLSYMLDISLFGEIPGPMAVGRSAFVAALFALHPLHIESVAWVAERKDVLSTCFWFLATLAYVRYVRRPGLARYGLVLLAYALGLLTKPMLVTLPATLLLLDIWPLRRYQGGTNWPARGVRLFLEKVPLFVLAAGSSVATVIAQYGGKSMTTLDVLP
ncbi:MAG: glycosyltransferase family 39 protein, partial [Candidatus Hydrogenedentes bacterium]|nr:glycosyltransferase family 39 protein [Candidatus Hydrogenedentota bacterium]